MTFAELKILAQKHGRNLGHMASGKQSRRALTAVLVLFALPVFGVLTAFGVASDSQLDKVPRREMIELLAMPASEESMLVMDGQAQFRASDRVQRGDTVAVLLQKLHVNDQAAFNFIRTDKSARSIFQLRPGRTVQAVTHADGTLQSFAYLHSADQYLQVTRDGSGFTAEELTLSPAAQQVYKSGTIRSSLYGATDEAGIPDAIATQIARIFSTDIDFHIDLRKGDRFTVIYEMLYTVVSICGLAACCRQNSPTTAKNSRPTFLPMPRAMKATTRPMAKIAPSLFCARPSHSRACRQVSAGAFIRY